MTTKECLHRFCADCIITALRSGWVLPRTSNQQSSLYWYSCSDEHDEHEYHVVLFRECHIHKEWVIVNHSFQAWVCTGGFRFSHHAGLRRFEQQMWNSIRLCTYTILHSKAQTFAWINLNKLRTGGWLKNTTCKPSVISSDYGKGSLALGPVNINICFHALFFHSKLFFQFENVFPSCICSNKECPTCRKKLVSKRSLRPDPNFDALISK